MKGLELSRKFYEQCRPALMAEIPDIMSLAAVGLAGEGSECFGMDDEFSRDHDFGPGFCLWLPEKTLLANMERIENAIARLPLEFMGYPSRMPKAARNGRIGPLAIEKFYEFFTGIKHPPATLEQWLAMRECQLAAAVNGEVFEDNGGQFSQWRNILLDFYPQDVFLKKLAANVMLAAQSGQYNLPRTLQRGDGPSAMLAKARFAEAALAMVYLFNRRYMPFYKWAPKMAGSLPILGEKAAELLDFLAASRSRDSRDLPQVEMVEEFCSACAAHLRAIGLSAEKDSWLWAHGPQIISRVKDPGIRSLNLLEA